MSEKMMKALAQAVVDMDEDEVDRLSNQCITEGIDAFEAIDKGLTAGMEEAGKLFEEEEYFVPELLSCADAMNVGIDILKPYLTVDSSQEKHKVVVGVIEGDTHDIGKNLVVLMLDTAGFDVTDAGRDVPPEKLVDIAVETQAEIIVISTLMTTTMDAMEEVIHILNERGIRDQFKVMVGGGPISQAFSDKIGADGYSKNAADAVKLAKQLAAVE
ncbi:corrinoid protein [uncultured Ruminococcus sp.]|uniref:corrinoid protein n=1 Tax=uncultured Ruminococcus sp. TaxID=165186 RepID=UPI00260FECC8|nr:corrinoid protein [uncultured Ruminococcus sp.]